MRTSWVGWCERGDAGNRVAPSASGHRGPLKHRARGHGSPSPPSGPCFAAPPSCCHAALI
ncbi:hypothetical protein E2C01_079649 [Portunus trituberculatus]|uniref:Uncharacterized protein n=1 Tax=Portunus trituberculatus TaxID=210409 RepID=A0A5B7ITW5_PORTR|nr:hypothetical protein [Portunus trituberculatus]